MPVKRLSIIVSAAAFDLALAAIPRPAAAHDEPVVGSLIGAGIGAAVAGPPGAAAGAIIGGAFGSHVAHETDHGTHAHPHRRAYIERRHYRESVAYAPARYANGNGNGSTRVHCEPQAKADYKPRVVHRDDRTRVASKAVAKPKMKKVCRYVPVRKTNSAAAAYRSAG
jgi:hypothetical protein